MKKALRFILLFASCYGFSQNIKATYNFTRINTDPNIAIPDWYIPYVFSYEYSNGKSISKILSGPQPGPHIKTPTENTHYKDLTNNSYQWELVTDSKTYSVKDKLPDSDWNIGTETQIIKGHTCTRATGTSGTTPVIAWFANDIKVTDGPLRYCGLPGLILKLEVNGTNEFNIATLEFIKQPIKIDPPKNKSNFITIEALQQIVNKLAKP